MTNQTPATRWGAGRQPQAERTRRDLRVKQSARKGSRALGRAAASLSGWKGEGPTLSDAELQRRPLPARGHISRRVFLDRSWRAAHGPGFRQLLVSSLAVASLVVVPGCGPTAATHPQPPP